MAKLEEPDTGYAWVVAFSACIINMILSGMARMIGILYVAIIEAYDVSREEASVPFTVRNAVRYLSGPVVGVLGQQFGIRIVTFFGGIIAAMGSILCCFAPTVTWISVFWGCIHGLGFSLGNTLFQVVVNQYFEKYRATASGIVLSGACIGSFAFPVMLESILNSYGIFGCFLLLGGMFLNVLPPSLVLKSPLWIEHPEYYVGRQRDSIKNKIPEAPPATTEKEMADDTNYKYVRSLSNCSIQELDIYSLVHSPHQKMYPDFKTPCSRKLRMNSLKNEKEKSNVICTLYTVMASDMDSKDNLNTKRKQSAGDANNDPKSTKRCDNGSTTTLEKGDSKKKESFLQNLKDIVLLYRNPVYILISLCVACYFWVFIPVLTVVIDYSRDKGIADGDAKYLIHALTIGDLVGRVGFGWVTDKKVLTFPIFMVLVLVFQGIFVALFPLAVGFWLYLTVLILYGVTAGIIFVHFPVLVYKYMDEKKQSLAVGCIGLVSGVVSFGMPPLIGLFRDQVGSYDGLFYILGLVSVLTGSLWFLEPLFLKIANRYDAGHR